MLLKLLSDDSTCMTKCIILFVNAMIFEILLWMITPGLQESSVVVHKNTAHMIVSSGFGPTSCASWSQDCRWKSTDAQVPVMVMDQKMWLIGSSNSLRFLYCPIRKVKGPFPVQLAKTFRHCKYALQLLRPLRNSTCGTMCWGTLYGSDVSALRSKRIMHKNLHSRPEWMRHRRHNADRTLVGFTINTPFSIRPHIDCTWTAHQLRRFRHWRFL